MFIQSFNVCMDTMLSLLAHTKGGFFFMLYTAVTNDWGETTYIPTTLGNALLVIILAALLAAVLFARMQMKKTAAAPASSHGDHKDESQQAYGKAGGILCHGHCPGNRSFNIKLFHFPTGGSIFAVHAG